MSTSTSLICNPTLVAQARLVWLLLLLIASPTLSSAEATAQELTASHNSALAQILFGTDPTHQRPFIQDQSNVPISPLIDAVSITPNPAVTTPGAQADFGQDPQ
ncbi:MAG TPA: hypothetical protein PLY96_16285, partial [Chromatiaceae bacterium]|nr:hypothetical protein [Chromatiaceae bacterium]